MGMDFGGAWTEDKVSTIENYAKMLIRALGKKFDVHYIDGFAGDGIGASPSLGASEDQLPIIQSTETIIESAASRISNLPFTTMNFIERDEKNIVGLQKLVSQKELKSARVHHGDANTKTLDILAQFGDSDRALVFFDPFGLELKWGTLEAIAKQPVYCDIFYLLPIYRVNTSIKNADRSILPHMRNSLEICLGMEESEIIKQVFSIETEKDLFGDSESVRRNEKAVERLFINRLRQIFCYVNEPPLKLVNSRNGHLFSLILCSNNPSKPAQSLIERFAKAAMKGR